MNVEELDGFQCALICGPEIVHVGEYLPQILGVDLENAKVSSKEETLNRLLSCYCETGIRLFVNCNPTDSIARC